jgi:hypothetical protein
VFHGCGIGSIFSRQKEIENYDIDDGADYCNDEGKIHSPIIIPSYCRRRALVSASLVEILEVAVVAVQSVDLAVVAIAVRYADAALAEVGSLVADAVAVA